MRIGVAGCVHETNTFAPGKTVLEDFKREWIVGKADFFHLYQGTKTSMGGMIDSADQGGFELVPLLYTQTTPSGIVSGQTMDTILANMCRMLEKAAETLDGLVLILHGAMVSENYDDVEGQIIRRAREILGEKPIATTLDLHANISDAMVSYSDLLIGYDTYPHVDIYERAREACERLVALIRHEIKPTHYIARPNVLIAPSMMDTSTEPMKMLMEKAFQYEREPDVLNVLIAGGFPYSDVSFAGMSIVVTTNHNEGKAKQIAEQLSTWVSEHREKFHASVVTVEQALNTLMEYQSHPIILIESSDNVGGGSPADATHTLKELVSRKVERFLVVICDPEAVMKATEIGISGTFECEVGGKTDRRFGRTPLHGDPIRIKGRVRLLSDGHYVHRGPYMAGKQAEMGMTAVIQLEDCQNSVVVLTEKRVAPWDVNHVRSIGLDPEMFRIIVVKAAIAWKTAFGEYAKHAIELDTPGCCSVNLKHFDYKNIGKDIRVLSH